MISEKNKMGTMAIPRLLVVMAGPLAVSLMVQAFYNVVDSLFISEIGEDALAALSLAAIPQHLMSATASGIGVGINAVTASFLGKKERELASLSAMNGILLEIFCALIFMLFGLFGTEMYFSFYTRDSEIVSCGVEYLSICTFFSAGMFGEVTFERLLQTTGKTGYTMLTQAFGSVLNIFLDWILVSGHLGASPMGVKGAAIATVISQCCAMCVAIFLNIRKNRELHFSVTEWTFEPEIFRQILVVGLPSTAMGTVGSIANFFLNRLIAGFSTTAVAVFGIYNRLQQFILAPMMGLNNSMVSIVAYNMGAEDRERVRTGIRWGLISGFCVMSAATFCFVRFPEFLLAPFHPTEEMLEVGLPVFRIIGVTFLLSPPSQILSSVFQGMGNGFYSLITTLSRQVLIRLPLAYFFAGSGDMGLIWYCWPIAEALSDLMSLYFWKRLRKKCNIHKREQRPKKGD